MWVIHRFSTEDVDKTCDMSAEYHPAEFTTSGKGADHMRMHNGIDSVLTSEAGWLEALKEGPACFKDLCARLERRGYQGTLASGARNCLFQMLAVGLVKRSYLIGKRSGTVPYIQFELTKEGTKKLEENRRYIARFMGFANGRIASVTKIKEPMATAYFGSRVETFDRPPTDHMLKLALQRLK